MENRGRRSAESLSVVTSIPGQRLAPPAHLSPSEIERWKAVTATKPADWFQADTAPLLEAYVRGETIALTLAKQLEAFLPEWLTTEDGIERYKALTGMYQKQSSVLCALATKMRISQQSRYDAKTAATAANKGGRGAPKPWERPGA